MNNALKIAMMALILICNGINAAFIAKSIREGNLAWYWAYFTSFISASIFAFQLKNKLLPLTVTSVFQTFFFHAAWYVTAFFILNNELQGHKIFGLIVAFVGMLIMSI